MRWSDRGRCRARTCDLRLVRAALYATELSARPRHVSGRRARSPRAGRGSTEHPGGDDALRHPGPPRAAISRGPPPARCEGGIAPGRRLAVTSCRLGYELTPLVVDGLGRTDLGRPATLALLSQHLAVGEQLATPDA